MLKPNGPNPGCLSFTAAVLMSTSHAGMRPCHLGGHQAQRYYGLERQWQAGCVRIVLVGWKNEISAVDRLRGIRRVQRREHQVSGVAAASCGSSVTLSRIRDEESRPGPGQHVPKRRLERQRVGAHFALRDVGLPVAMQESIGSSTVMMLHRRLMLMWLIIEAGRSTAGPGDAP